MKSLLRALHKHFIPGEHNDYQPYFLRLKIAGGVLALVLVLESFYLAQTFIVLPHSDYFAAVLASALVDETNTERQTGSLSFLATNRTLEAAAQLKADDMAAKGYFAHNSPDGKTPWYWFDQVGYDYAAAGENLAVNFTDSKDVTEAWMHSPTHRANIMNGNYTEIGIATARGTYKGKEAIFVVQEFGRPSLIARQINMVAEAGQAASSTAKTIEEMIAGKTKSVTPIIPAPRAQPIAKASTLTSKQKIATTSLPVVNQEPRVTTTVAGAETKRLDVATPAVSAPLLEHAHASRLDLLLASPRQATTTIYLILAAILALALGLAVFIKIRVQYPHIIANGVLLLAITLSLAMLNSALVFARGII